MRLLSAILGISFDSSLRIYDVTFFELLFFCLVHKSILLLGLCVVVLVCSIKCVNNEIVDRYAQVRRMPQALASGKLKRTTSTPQILEPTSLTPSTPSLPPKMTNGVISARTTPTPLRFATTPSQKGLMHRFLATRGKIFRSQKSSVEGDLLTPPATPTIALNPLSLKAFGKTLDMKIEHDDEPKKPPTRKGYIPVEEKIQKELNEMKERENELR